MKVSHEGERDVEWFKVQLQERGVAVSEIAWEDYRSNFVEIPSHLLDRYLKYRPLFLHKAALEVILHEEEVLQNHPFAHCG